MEREKEKWKVNKKLESNEKRAKWLQVSTRYHPVEVKFWSLRRLKILQDARNFQDFNFECTALMIRGDQILFLLQLGAKKLED